MDLTSTMKVDPSSRVTLKSPRSRCLLLRSAKFGRSTVQLGYLWRTIANAASSPILPFTRDSSVSRFLDPSPLAHCPCLPRTLPRLHVLRTPSLCSLVNSIVARRSLTARSLRPSAFAVFFPRLPTLTDVKAPPSVSTSGDATGGATGGGSAVPNPPKRVSRAPDSAAKRQRAAGRESHSA